MHEANFDKDHNTPCFSPQILHNQFPISPGYYNRPKKNRIRSLCKILGGKQGALSNVKMVNSFSEDLILILS